jgi:hypothetical protein
MGDARVERLSRFIDGDLDRAEERDFRTRLESEPALAAELTALIAVRRSLAALATRERAPAELDSLVEPLLRGRPEPFAIRPWARWLAAAAMVIVGLTVMYEVNFGHRALDLKEKLARRSLQPAVEPTEPFALVPLPTSSVPPEKQPIGVGERLLASSIPDIEPGHSPALEVIGTLEEVDGDDLSPPRDTDVGSKSRKEREIAGIEAARADELRAQAAPPAPPPTSKVNQMKGRAKTEDISSRDAESSGSRLWRDQTTTGRGQLFIFIEGETAWRDFETTAFCSPGRYAVRVKVSGDMVTEVWSVGGATSDKTSHRLCAGQLIVGLTIAGVPTGEYAAEVVVGPRGERK